jgi:hypothetical protein
MYFHEIRYVGVDWIHLPENRNQWQAPVNRNQWQAPVNRNQWQAPVNAVMDL